MSFAGPAISATTTTATISGLVVDDSGIPVAGARVTYNNSPVITRDQFGHITSRGASIGSFVTTAANGTFTITGLPASIWWVCAWGTKNTQLRSCEWGQTTARVDLSTATSAPALTLKVVNGSFLTFKVNDLRGQIHDPAYAARAASPNFQILVVQGIQYAAPQFLSAANGVRQYGLAVPKNSTLRLYLNSSLHVLDGSNAAIPVHQLSETIASGRLIRPPFR